MNHRYRRALIRAAGFLGLVGPGPQLNPQLSLVLPAEVLAGVEENSFHTANVAANGEVVLATVPEGELWQIKFVTYGVDSGTFTIDDLFIAHKDATLGNLVMDSSNVTVAYDVADLWLQAPAFWLYPGQAIGMTISGYSVAGVVNLKMRAMKIAYSADSAN